MTTVWTRAAIVEWIASVADALRALETDYGPDPSLDARWNELDRVSRSLIGRPLTRDLPPFYACVGSEPESHARPMVQ